MQNLFFGIQVAVSAPPTDPWRSRLTTIVRQHMRDLELADKRGFYGSLANLLLDGVDRMPLGFWDFVPDGQREYDDWVKGIEDDSAEPWRPDPTGATAHHLLVSMMLLVPEGTPAAELLGERCDLPEDRWRRRSTYRHLFDTLPQIDFGSVRSDAVYVTPGGEREGFALRELEGAGYDYLLRIE